MGLLEGGPWESVVPRSREEGQLELGINLMACLRAQRLNEALDFLH